MIGGIQQHYAPNAFVIFQYINAGVILLNLPEVRHIKAEQIADNRLVYCRCSGACSGPDELFAGAFAGWQQ